MPIIVLTCQRDECYNSERTHKNHNKGTHFLKHGVSVLTLPKLKLHISILIINYPPHVEFRNQLLPEYLGVAIYRHLTYIEHLNKTAAKNKTRNKVLHKRTGSS